MYMRTGIPFSLTAFALAKAIAQKQNRLRDSCMARPCPAAARRKGQTTLMPEVVRKVLWRSDGKSSLQGNLLWLCQGHKLLAQPHARAKYSRFHRGYGDSQRLCQFPVRPSFRLLKYEGILQRGIQSAKDFAGQLFTYVFTLGILPAIFDLREGPRLIPQRRSEDGNRRYARNSACVVSQALH